MSSETAANWWPNLWPLYLIHLYEQKWDQCEWLYLWMITIQIWSFFRNSSQLPQPVTTPHPLFPVQVNLKYIWIILSFQLFLFLEFGVILKVCHTYLLRFNFPFQCEKKSKFEIQLGNSFIEWEEALSLVKVQVCQSVSKCVKWAQNSLQSQRHFPTCHTPLETKQYKHKWKWMKMCIKIQWKYPYKYK